jgi:hypothetical protein
VEALLPLAAKGIAIVGLEPSCLLTLRDERWPWAWAMRRGRWLGQALLLEEFLAREAQAGQLEASRPGCGR